MTEGAIALPAARNDGGGRNYLMSLRGVHDEAVSPRDCFGPWSLAMTEGRLLRLGLAMTEGGNHAMTSLPCHCEESATKQSVA